MNRQKENESKEIANIVIDTVIQIHKTLGPGLFVNAYQKCLQHALQKEGLNVICGKKLPVVYDGVKIDAGYKLDMLVEDLIVIENKTVDRLTSDDEEELTTYLKFSDCKLGMLINWKTLLIKQSIKRIEL